MKRMLASLLMIPVLLGLVGCGEGKGNSPSNGPQVVSPAPSEVPQVTSPNVAPSEVLQGASSDFAVSDKPRVTSPSVSPSDLSDLVAGNSAFAFELYKYLTKEDSNFIYSPYSISAALAMTYAGAQGETRQQMAEVLHFVLPQERLHTTFNGLDLELANLGKDTKTTNEKGFRLNIVNAVWGQKDYKFLPEFLDVLAQNYGAGLRLLDFANKPEESRATINDWVSAQTKGKIQDLIPQGVIDDLTRLVLTNAIYFNAAWLKPFKGEMSHDGTFHLLDGRDVTVPMMMQSEIFLYAEGDGYQAVELAYDVGRLSMLILLPEKGQFEAFESKLNAEYASAITKDLDIRQVDLTMPKFKFQSDFSLAKALAALGMPNAFSLQEADFSGMSATGELPLFIQEVVHKAFVSVDEVGTEAAAATSIVVGGMGGPQGGPVQVIVDRPFVFLIRDTETGAILFVGRVVDPSG